MMTETTGDFPLQRGGGSLHDGLEMTWTFYLTLFIKTTKSNFTN